jgi:hypothetical protein
VAYGSYVASLFDDRVSVITSWVVIGRASWLTTAHPHPTQLACSQAATRSSPSVRSAAAMALAATGRRWIGVNRSSWTKATSPSLRLHGTLGVRSGCHVGLRLEPRRVWALLASIAHASGPCGPARFVSTSPGPPIIDALLSSGKASADEKIREAPVLLTDDDFAEISSQSRPVASLLRESRARMRDLAAAATTGEAQT